MTAAGAEPPHHRRGGGLTPLFQTLLLLLDLVVSSMPLLPSFVVVVGLSSLHQSLLRQTRLMTNAAMTWIPGVMAS